MLVLSPFTRRRVRSYNTDRETRRCKYRTSRPAAPSYMLTTSGSLLERLRQPDADSWARFVELYTPLLLRWTGQLGLQAADGDDLVQEVFGILVKKLPEFEYDPARRFRGWLRTVLVHRWHNWPRRVAVPLNVDPAGSDPGDEVQEE